MMMMTSEWAFILDEADVLSSMILNSEPVRKYQKARQAVYGDRVLVEKIAAFNRMKEQYEDVQRFGKYHPDYYKIMKEIRKQKRELDLNEKVADLKLAENELQDMLDEISLILAKAVSEAVKVPVSNPFFETSCHSGGCGSGGKCSCSVS